jgi:hypothetical protein
MFLAAALFAFGGAWFIFAMLRWLYSDSEMRAIHPPVRRYLGLFGLPGTLISAGCLALAAAVGLDPFNFQISPNPWIAICFWIIAVTGAASLLCSFVYGGWHYMDSIADLRRTGDEQALMAFRNREILGVGFGFSAFIATIVIMLTGANYGNLVVSLALAAIAFAVTFLIIALFLRAILRPHTR